MDKIRLGLFDIFAYLLPGSFLLFSLVVVFNPEIKELGDMIMPFRNLSLSTGIILILASYILGFALHVPGWWLLQIIGLKIWKRFKYKTTQLEELKDRSKNMVLVRELSKSNARYIELWYALSSMSRTFSLAFVLFSIVSVIKSARPDASGPWILLGAIMLFFSVVLLYRSAQAYSWAVRDLKNAVDQLYLKDRARMMIDFEQEEAIHKEV